MLFERVIPSLVFQHNVRGQRNNENGGNAGREANCGGIGDAGSTWSERTTKAG